MDRQSALAKLKKEGYLLRDMPQYHDDKELVLAAVKDYGLALKQASPALQNNRQIVMAAVKNNGMAIDYASPSLQKDKAIMKAAKAQEQGLEDAMTKKYKKGGRKTRKRRGGWLQTPALNALYSHMATGMRDPSFSADVRVPGHMFSREVRLLAAARIHNLPYSSDEMNVDKQLVIKNILDEQMEDDPTKLIRHEDVYAKATQARGTGYYPFFNSVSDAEISELIKEVSTEINRRKTRL